LKLEGPEYETINAFGGICLIDDIREILYLNDICDRLGIDTISAGNLAGFAIEASHRKDLGLPAGVRDVDGIAPPAREMALKKDEGAVLAEGIVHASREWGPGGVAVPHQGHGAPPATSRGC